VRAIVSRVAPVSNFSAGIFRRPVDNCGKEIIVGQRGNPARRRWFANET